MIRSDFHTHTVLCDGKNTPREMVEAALQKGMTALGFSGHVYLPEGAEWCMSRENTVLYRRQVADLQQEYAGRLRILRGIEQDVYASEPTDEWDYIIGSVHYFEKNGVLADVDHTASLQERAVRDLFDGDWYAAAENYFAAVTLLPQRTRMDIIGHLDLMSKFNEDGRYFDENHPRYLEAAMQAIDSLIPLKIPFEVNTGAISRGYRSVPYPAVPLLEYIREKGGRVILSGDAHSTEGLCYRFGTWEPRIRAMGLEIVEL